MSDPRWPHLRGKYIGVLGPIAAGKSTLLKKMETMLAEDRPEDKIIAFDEFFPNDIFEAYQKDPHLMAERFQTVMAAFAATRDVWAHKFLTEKFFPTGTMLCERPLLENEIFFANNVDAGFIDRLYEQTYNCIQQQFRPYAPDVLIYLNVTESRSIERMMDRADKDPSRESEKSYDSEYLRKLGKAYFTFVFQYKKDDSGPPLLIVNWNDQAATDKLYTEKVEWLLENLDAYFAAGCPQPLSKIVKVSISEKQSLWRVENDTQSEWQSEWEAQTTSSEPDQLQWVLRELAAADHMTFERSRVKRDGGITTDFDMF